MSKRSKSNREEWGLDEAGDNLAQMLAGVLATSLADRGGPTLKRWLRGRRPRGSRMVRGALAGAAAGGVLALTRWVRGERPDLTSLLDTLLGGTARGVIYTAVVDPLLPGHPVVKGALVGSAEYLASPWGGVLKALADVSPVARLPLVHQLMEAGDAEDDPFVAYLLFGLALALLTGDDD